MIFSELCNMALDVLLLVLSSCNCLVDGMQSRVQDDDFLQMDGNLPVPWSRGGLGSKSAASVADQTIE